MKIWSRAVLLFVVLILSSSALVSAEPWYPNTCYISCDGTQYPVSASSAWECCTGHYFCPDNSSPITVIWSGGPGEYPMLCGLWQD